MKAFSYLRVSGRGQVDGDGFPRQRAAIAAYAQANGIEIVREFQERGVSGKTEWDDRPQWVDMVASLNGVCTIVIERLDRLARDLGVQEHIIRDLKKRRVTLISTVEPDLGNSDPTRVLFRQIMGSISQYDRAMIEAKLRAARVRMKARTGRCEGRKPFGYFDAEKKTLQRIWHRRVQGASSRTIAAELNADQCATRAGRQWNHATISKIIKRGIKEPNDDRGI